GDGLHLPAHVHRLPLQLRPPLRPAAQAMVEGVVHVGVLLDRFVQPPHVTLLLVYTQHCHLLSGPPALPRYKHAAGLFYLTWTRPPPAAWPAPRHCPSARRAAASARPGPPGGMAAASSPTAARRASPSPAGPASTAAAASPRA